LYVYGYAVFDTRDSAPADIHEFKYERDFGRGLPSTLPPGSPTYRTDITGRWADIR
jgi:hypothetical protein